MEVCAYSCSEPDSSPLLCQYGAHSQEEVSHMPASELPLSAPTVNGSDQIVVLDSSRIAMQIASGQIVWPILPKPKEVFPKLEPDIQQGLPYVDANGELHSEMENSDLALGQAGTPMEKCKVRKRLRQTSENGEAHGGDGYEKQAIMRWKDAWVAQLIHIRGRMQATFSGPQKQRIDLWQVVKSEMARTCHGFDKDSEACRKKWRRVYKEYKDDKCLRAAGNGSQKCKFYELLEFYMGEKTNGTCDSQLSAVGYSIPPLIGSVKDEDIGEEGRDSMMPPHATIPHGTDELGAKDAAASPSVIGEARATKRPYRRAKSHSVANESVASVSLQSLLSELLSVGKELLETTRHYEQAKIDVLHVLKESLHEISKDI